MAVGGLDAADPFVAVAHVLTSAGLRKCSGKEHLFVAPELSNVSVVAQVLDLFSPPVRDWFSATFAEPKVGVARPQDPSARRPMELSASCNPNTTESSSRPPFSSRMYQLESDSRSTPITKRPASSLPTAPRRRTGMPKMVRARDVFAPLPPARYSIESTNVVPRPQCNSSTGLTRVSYTILPQQIIPDRVRCTMPSRFTSSVVAPSMGLCSIAPVRHAPP